MTRWLRWTTALLLCVVGIAIGPGPAAVAAPTTPPAAVGPGTVVADLGIVQNSLQPGFSVDGAYYAYLVAAGDACDVRLFDIAARRQVTLANPHVACDGQLVFWAAQTDTLVWQGAAATAGEATEYAWDAGSGRTSVLAADAHVLAAATVYVQPAISADGRFLSFEGRSDTHPAPAVDTDPLFTGYVYDRSTGVSLPLSKPGVHLQLATWGPGGHTFVAAANGRNDIYGGPDACFGSGTSCRIVPDVYPTLGGARWSRDGKAVIAYPGDSPSPLVYDFTDSSATRVPTGKLGGVRFARPFGPAGRWVLAAFDHGAAVWDRTTGKVTPVSYAKTYPSPNGRYLMDGDDSNGTFRLLDLTTPDAPRPSSFVGTDGYWTPDESTFLGTGPGGCTSLRQWSRSANVVSRLGPLEPNHCFALPDADFVKTPASASGRFALLYERRKDDASISSVYVADLRRHVLIGPFAGGLEDEGFAPGGPEVFALQQRSGSSDRVVLVDPTPVPDVDDKPRWSASTPANGSAFDLTAGQQVHLTIGAFDPQQTPVELTFRWRARNGLAVATPVPGWSCTQRRLAGGAIQADCTFAANWPRIDQRYVDVSARNSVTGAQSDTRSYQVTSRPAPTRR